MKGSSIVTLAAVGIGGWWLYNNWASITGANPAVAAGEVPTTTPPPANPQAITVAIPPPAAPAPAPSLLSPAALIAALKSAAAGDPALKNGTMNQDQWNYYRNTIAPPALTAAQLASAYPPGNEVAITADQFVNQLHSVGLAAYRPRGRARINYRRAA
jgi:hypothetical protein